MSAFIPTTDRQIQLVEDIKRLHARHKERSAVVQFSERDQDYFKINLKVLMERLQETTETALAFDEKTGAIQYKEFTGADSHSAFEHHGYKRIHGDEKSDFRIYKHPSGHVATWHAGANQWHHIANHQHTSTDDEAGPSVGTGYRTLHQHLKEFHDQ